MITEFLLKQGYKCAETSFDVNYTQIPVTCLTPTEENAELFNKIIKLCRDEQMKEIVRTKSGGISKTRGSFSPHSFDYIYSRTSAEITIISEYSWRIQFRAGASSEEGNKISGSIAFKEFKKELKKDGINLDDYEIADGIKVKEEIEKPLIKMASVVYKDEVFTNAHHIDFHNSYPAGLANTHPEFRPTVERLYTKRKENPMYKAVLNLSIGYMQSKWCGYRYTHLSRDAINDNNKRIRDLASRLKNSDRAILAYNTDGIWYTGEIYHGEGEGSKLGEWENDHTNCTIRMKSNGAYEFIENGVYTPVVRGYTNLDKIKDRTHWEWGDIYQAELIVFTTDENGIKIKEGALWSGEGM